MRPCNRRVIEVKDAIVVDWLHSAIYFSLSEISFGLLLFTLTSPSFSLFSSLLYSFGFPSVHSVPSDQAISTLYHTIFFVSPDIIPGFTYDFSICSNGWIQTVPSALSVPTIKSFLYPHTFFSVMTYLAKVIRHLGWVIQCIQTVPPSTQVSRRAYSRNCLWCITNSKESDERIIIFKFAFLKYFLLFNRFCALPLDWPWRRLVMQCLGAITLRIAGILCCESQGHYRTSPESKSHVT